MKKDLKDLIILLNENNENFEFYPTTAKIAERIYRCLDDGSSILDIGAGSGHFFKLIDLIDKRYRSKDQYYRWRVGDKYAIEKSQILIESLNKDIAIVGTDFEIQTLIDKKVNVIFSNPPYSMAENWVNKIIREANCQTAFIVMPLKKWDNSESIKESLKLRKAKVDCILEYDYRDSEFRKARTIVGVYKISFVKSYYGSCNSKPEVDPFDLWFDDNFKLSERVEKIKLDDKIKAQNQLVKGRNLIETLEALYNNDLNAIRESYESIAGIPFNLLKELNINKETVLKSLQLRISGTKNLYWRELFKKLDVVIKKLTHKSRENVLKKLTESTSVDFSASNAYAVICWCLKNVNSYFDSQLVSVYKELTSSENIKSYKSNQRFEKENFRFCNRDKWSNYKLDYRLILAGRTYPLNASYSDAPKNLNDYDNEFIFNKIQDLFIVANNLGFELAESFPVADWGYGKNRDLCMKNGEVLARAKIYKNGNFHFKLNMDFMKAFNVEAGRLLGWLKSPKQASEELNIKEKDCMKFFDSNLSLENNEINLLLN